MVSGRLWYWAVIALVGFAGFGCSNSNVPTDPASRSDNLTTETKMVRLEPVSNSQSNFLGTWRIPSSDLTLSITRMGQGRFKLHSESFFGGWHGIGHERGNELIAIFWFEWNVQPQFADHHGFVTYWIDANDVMHRTSYWSDGAVGSTGTLVRGH